MIKMFNLNTARIATLTVVVASAGCSTYLEERNDLTSCGGQSCRVIDAQNRQANARATQQGLVEDQRSANEELAALQQELQSVSRNRQVQEQRLQQARSSQKISAEDAARLKRQLNSQSDAINDTALQAEAANSSGNSALVAKKLREFAALKKELNDTNREIEILSKS